MNMAITTTSRKTTIKKTTKAKAKTPAKIDLQEKLQEYFGFDSFKGDQAAIIDSLLSGKDTFVIMPTGAAKAFATNCPP